MILPNEMFRGEEKLLLILSRMVLVRIANGSGLTIYMVRDMEAMFVANVVLIY